MVEMTSAKVGTWNTSSGGKRKLQVKGEDCSGLPGCVLGPRRGEAVRMSRTHPSLLSRSCPSGSKRT